MPAVTATTNTPTQDAQQSGVGPLASLEPTQDPYRQEQLKYPLTGIGGTDIPSHVVFYINVPTGSKFATNNPGEIVAGAQSASQQNYDTLKTSGGIYQPIQTNSNLGHAVETSALQNLFYKGPKAALSHLVKDTQASAIVRTLNLKPSIQRIRKTIAIYMPDTIAYQYSHQYGNVDETDAYGELARAAALGGDNPLGILVDTFRTLKNGAINNQSTNFNSAADAEIVDQLSENSGGVGKGFTDLALKSFNRAINPHAEMIFRTTEKREFEFIFDLIPRSAKEAAAINDIIKTFKVFAAPEVSSEAGGRYYIPPAQFDIKFYFQNQENPAIARISTCVLKNIRVNYNGSGQWATMNDGQPMHIQLALDFAEVDVLTRELIDKEGY